MSIRSMITVLDDILGDWHPVWSPYGSYRTYQHESCQWWVVLTRTGEHAGQVRISRTDAAGRHRRPFDSSTGWVSASTGELWGLLASSGAPDLNTEVAS